MVSGGPSKYLRWLRRDNFTTFTSKYLCWLAETILQHRAKFTTKSKSEVFYMKSKGRHQKQIRHCHGEFEVLNYVDPTMQVAFLHILT